MVGVFIESIMLVKCLNEKFMVNYEAPPLVLLRIFFIWFNWHPTTAPTAAFVEGSLFTAVTEVNKNEANVATRRRFSSVRLTDWINC